ncbi:MAG: hypothetical protein ACRDV0_08345 [Acidimicrobiales bacterium]
MLRVAALAAGALLARSARPAGPGATTPYLSLSPAVIAASHFVFVALSPRKLEGVRVSPQAAFAVANKWGSALRGPDTTATMSLGALTEPGGSPPFVRVPVYAITFYPVGLLQTGFVTVGQKPSLNVAHATQVEFVNATTGRIAGGVDFTG